jgi:hypothetical protein
LEETIMLEKEKLDLDYEEALSLETNSKGLIEGS